MRQLYFSLLGLLCLNYSTQAQPIEFNELLPGPDFFDARNGMMAQGDIDNDGDIDLFIAGNDNSTLRASLYTNDGSGSFSLVPNTPFDPMQFGSAEFADVDGDDDLDLLVSGFNLQTVYFAQLYLNDGSGNFSLVPNTPFQEFTEGDIAFGDIDNDSDLDVVLVGFDPQGDGFATLYENDGSGGFTELSSSTLEAAKGGAIAFFDFDNDDDQDLIISGENNNDVPLTTLYENNGSGIYTPVPNTPFSGVSFGDIGIADVDNDTDLDVLVNGSLGSGNNSTEIYLNDGGGSFSLLAGTNFPQTTLGDTEFTDFDNDGDMDLLITGSIIGAEFAADIFENDGNASFVLAEVLNPMYLTSTAIADFDGDNDLDIVMLGINNSTDPFKTRMFTNISTILGTNDPGMNTSLNLFPNPAREHITLSSTNNSFRAVALYSIMGRLLFSTELDSNNYTLDLEQYAAGTYFLKISTSNNESITRKLIKN